MRIVLLSIIVITAVVSLSQDDWKLPLNNGKIQFEYDSKKMNSGGKDLCSVYMAPNAFIDLNNKLRASTTSGQVKFWTASTFTISPILWGAEISSGNATNAGKKYQNFCDPIKDDTLFGSLTMSITQVKTLRNSRSGTVKCVYRIILKEDNYQIKLQGFKYSYYTKATMAKPSELKTGPLEDEYDEENATKSDKAFWADIKLLIGIYHEKLEEVMLSQFSDFNFND